AGALAPFTELIAEEVNVKAVRLSDDPASLGRFELAVNPRVLGPRVGSAGQAVVRAGKAGGWGPARGGGGGGRGRRGARRASGASARAGWPGRTRPRPRRCPGRPG